MLTSIYTMSFAASLCGLIAWFYYQDQPHAARISIKLFILGFGTYLVSLLFADGFVYDKLFILFRDFMALSMVALFFNLIQKHAYVFVAALVLLYGGFKFGYSQVMQKSFNELSTVPAQQKTPSKKKDSKQTQDSDQLFYNDIPLAQNGEFLVELKEGKTTVELQLQMSIHGFDIDGKVRRAFTPEDEQSTTLDNFYLVDVHTDQEIDTLLKLLSKATELVEYHEFNEAVELSDPSDLEPNLDIDRSSYYANDPALSQSWSFDKLDINQLHLDINSKKISPKRKALIAILDTGVDRKHEDIKDRYRSFNKAYDRDPVSHGTHCAGIAAAVSNNGIGIASMSPNDAFVEVTSFTVLNGSGGGTQGSIISGMIEATDAGADVISMSLGGRSNPNRARAYDKAVKYANKHGAIVVVAAGNSNMNAKNYSPANAKGVITVSAVDIDINRAVFSNTVQDIKMGLAAPGVNIYSTVPGDGYKSYNGTSMAAPHVAGTIGMMKAIFPEMNTEDAFFILDKTGSTTDDTAKTGKLIQPARAIAYLTQMD